MYQGTKILGCNLLHLKVGSFHTTNWREAFVYGFKGHQSVLEHVLSYFLICSKKSKWCAACQVLHSFSWGNAVRLPLGLALISGGVYSFLWLHPLSDQEAPWRFCLERSESASDPSKPKTTWPRGYEASFQKRPFILGNDPIFRGSWRLQVVRKATFFLFSGW